jgi:hypothetical protein
MRPSLAAAPAAILLITAFLFTTSCGYIGGTLAPLANVPTAPKDLAAAQRGANIIAHFTVPSLTTENIPIKFVLDLDLRAGAAPATWNETEWAEQARRILPTHLTKIPAAGRLGAEQLIAEYEFPATVWFGKEVIIAARVIGSNGKASNWSTLVTLPVVSPMPKPADLTFALRPDGIRLTWRGSSPHYRVLRRAEGAGDFTELAVVNAPEYLDTSAEIGKSYLYEVLGFTEAAPHQEVQSDLSGELAVLYKDIFPPAAPAGLHAIASASTIELSWDGNTESDLAGYRVYRSTNGGAFEKTADVNEIPAYSDRTVERGKTYRYAITAMDKSGNESARSNVVEASLQ